MLYFFVQLCFMSVCMFVCLKHVRMVVCWCCITSHHTFCRVEISASEFSIPCIDKEGSMPDWFNGLQNTLMWNKRSVTQKPNEKK